MKRKNPQPSWRALVRRIADDDFIIKQRPGESDGKGNNTQ
jgi:hypothetical protein